jgi:hypothetical protein
MTEETGNELRERRASLSASLAELTEKRDDTYQRDNNARALDRAGVTDRSAQDVERLAKAQVSADTTLRDAQREIRRLDDEIERAPNGGILERIGRALRRDR